MNTTTRTHTIPTTDEGKRAARRLANYAFNLAHAIRWRERAKEWSDWPEMVQMDRQAMRAAALRAATWRNLLVEDAEDNA